MVGREKYPEKLPIALCKLQLTLPFGSRFLSKFACCLSQHEAECELFGFVLVKLILSA